MLLVKSGSCVLDLVLGTWVLWERLFFVGLLREPTADSGNSNMINTKPNATNSVALRQGKTPAAIARTAHGEPSLVSLLQASFECENDYCDMSFDGTSHVQQPPRFRSVRKRNLCTW